MAFIYYETARLTDDERCFCCRLGIGWKGSVLVSSIKSETQKKLKQSMNKFHIVSSMFSTLTPMNAFSNKRLTLGSEDFET